MTHVHSTPLLRMALIGDALASAGTGLLLAAGAGLLAGLFGLPETLLRGAGLVLLPYAAFVAWLGSREAVPRAAVLAVVAINALWAIDSLALLGGAWVSPTGLGTAFVVAQAGIVGGFALVQAYAVRTGAAPAHA